MHFNFAISKAVVLHHHVHMQGAGKCEMAEASESADCMKYHIADSG